MKIAHITSVHPFRDTRIFFKECISLAQAGYDTYLIAPDAPKAVIDGIHVNGFPLNRTNVFIRKVINPWKLFKQAIKVNANLYHFHDPELIIIGLLLKLFGKKIIYDVHEDYFQILQVRDYFNKSIRKLIAWVVNYLEKSLSRYFDAVVTATDKIAYKFYDYNDCVVTINNFSFELPERMISPKTSENIVVVFSGGIYSTRGLIELIDALNMFESRSIELFLCGTSDPPCFIDELIRRDNHGRVKYLGVLPFNEVVSLYQNANIGFICDYPEIRNVEGLPIKLFEYMSAGLPVIASNFPIWRKIVEDNYCGICVDPLNPNDIYKALEYLISNPSQATAMGINGKIAAKSKYSWQNESVKLVNLYKKIFS